MVYFSHAVILSSTHSIFISSGISENCYGKPKKKKKKKTIKSSIKQITESKLNLCRFCDSCKSQEYFFVGWRYLNQWICVNDLFIDFSVCLSNGFFGHRFLIDSGFFYLFIRFFNSFDSQCRNINISKFKLNGIK